MLGMDKTAISTIGTLFQFTVAKITRQMPAELTQEFFDIVYGKDNVKSEEAFRTKNAEAALVMINVESEKKYQHDLIDSAIENTKAPLPDDFLKRWLVKSNDKPITLEEVEKDYSNYSKGIKWQLIKGKIVKENNIVVSEEETINEATKFIKSQYAQYGKSDVPEKELNDIVQKIIGNQEEKNKITESLLEAKVIELLKSILITKEKDVNYEEFMKIVNKETSKEKSGISGFAKFLKSGFRKK
jgi:trigger factor